MTKRPQKLLLTASDVAQAMGENAIGIIQELGKVLRDEPEKAAEHNEEDVGMVFFDILGLEMVRLPTCPSMLLTIEQQPFHDHGLRPCLPGGMYGAVRQHLPGIIQVPPGCTRHPHKGTAKLESRHGQCRATTRRLEILGRMSNVITERSEMRAGIALTAGMTFDWLAADVCVQMIRRESFCSCSWYRASKPAARCYFCQPPHSNASCRNGQLVDCPLTGVSMYNRYA